MKKYILLLGFVLCIVSFSARAQLSDQDVELLAAYEEDAPQFEESEAQLGFGNDNWLLDYSLGSLMYFYQEKVSVQISASCLYHTSCSRYSKELFEHYSFPKAIFCTADRLLRCDRLAATDIVHYERDRKTGKVFETYEYYKFEEHAEE